MLYNRSPDVEFNAEFDGIFTIFSIGPPERYLYHIFEKGGKSKGACPTKFVVAELSKFVAPRSYALYNE